MSDPDRPNWFKRLSSSTTTSLRSFGLPISPSTSPPQPTAVGSPPRQYEKGSVKEKSATNSSETSRQSSLRYFRPSREQSLSTSEHSTSSTPTDRPPSNSIRHAGSLQSIMQNHNNNHTHYAHASTRSNTLPHAHQHQVGSRSRSLRIPPPLSSPPLGPLSSPGFPDSLFHASEFMIGAGMVILQPSTSRVVIVHETRLNYWFLPKGRKDVGESMEQAALREAYEESGYRAEFLPLYILTNAPTPPTSSPYRIPQRNTEPFYLSTHQWKRPRWPQGPRCNGGEYLTFWFIGQIPPDAVHENNTGMPDEVNYVSELVDIRTALQRLGEPERNIVRRAFDLWSQDGDYHRQVQDLLRNWEAEEATKALERAVTHDTLVGNKPDGDAQDEGGGITTDTA